MIRNLVNERKRLSTQEMLVILNILSSTVHRHLKKVGMILKLEIWVPHQFIERSRMDTNIFTHNAKESLLKHLITEDEKWILYNNFQRKRT